MAPLFPQAQVVAGILVLIIGFVCHWLGQLLSVVNWDLAVRLGLQEQGMLPEYKVYEQAMAVADVAVGWVYGLVGVGLILGCSWAFRLAWFPGSIMIYHSICAWFWTRNQKRAGRQMRTDAFWAAWGGGNFITGLLAVLVAWNGG
jgi:hypothetical protein